MPLAILLTLLLGALCGLINAGLIIYTKVNPLVITLGTLYLFAGSALLLSGMAGTTGYEGIGGFPMAFTDFANLDVWDSCSADYLPDMLPRFLALAA